MEYLTASHLESEPTYRIPFILMTNGGGKRRRRAILPHPAALGIQLWSASLLWRPLPLLNCCRLHALDVPVGGQALTDLATSICPLSPPVWACRVQVCWRT